MKTIIICAIVCSLMGCAAGSSNTISDASAGRYIEFLKEKETSHDRALMKEILESLEEYHPGSEQIKNDLMKLAVEEGRYEDAYGYNLTLLKMSPDSKVLLYTKASLEELSGRDPIKTYLRLTELEPENEYFLNKVSGLYAGRGDYKKAALFYGRLYASSGEKESFIDRYIALLYRAGEYGTLSSLNDSEPEERIYDRLIKIMIAENDVARMSDFISESCANMDKIQCAKFFFTYYYLAENEGDKEGERRYAGSGLESKASFYKASFMMENSNGEDDGAAANMLKEHALKGEFVKESLIYLMKHAIRAREYGLLTESYGRFKALYDDDTIELSLLYQAASEGYTDPGGALEMIKDNKPGFARLAGLTELLAVKGYADFSKGLFEDLVIRFGDEKDVMYELWSMGVRIYSRAGDTANMRRCYRKASSLAEKNGALMNHYAYSLLLQEGYSIEAMEILKEARKLLPGDPAVADSLGWAYYLKGDHDTALKLIDEALNAMPDDPEILYHKAKLMLGMGNAEYGIQLLREARDADKDGQLYYVDFENEIENSGAAISR